MCGEHIEADGHDVAEPGSSPHVRGTPERPPVGEHRGGIIPACAGNTHSNHTNADSHWDHPRMCGEHFAAARISSAVSGSSPHVRGTRASEKAAMAAQGIIPACAGNTTRSTVSWPTSRDHPRMCGEHSE